jgi:uncharacterized membrane-anchored protein
MHHVRREAMSAGVDPNGKGTRLTPHPLRCDIGSARAAVYATRDAEAYSAFAFDTAGDAARRDRAALADLCARRNRSLKPSVKQHRVVFSGAMLRWAAFEFTTYTWGCHRRMRARSIRRRVAGGAIPACHNGPVLVALDLHLLAEKKKKPPITKLFDRASLAVAENSDGLAWFATDFQADAAGFVRILVLDRGLGSERAGAVVQRIIELETYRTLALLGLPEAGACCLRSTGLPAR